MANQTLTGRTEFSAAINQICTERGIAPEVVINAINNALVTSFKKDFPNEAEKQEAEGKLFVGQIDVESGQFRVFIADPIPLTAEEEELLEKEAASRAELEKALEEGREPGEVFKSGVKRVPDTATFKEITPPGFGRIAAMAAKQVIYQTIREAEKESILADYSQHIGEVMTGMVQRMDGKNVVVDLGRGFGIIPPEEQVRSEFYRLNSRIAVYVKEITDTLKGKSLIVSRADHRLLEGLFVREVPEVSSGAVRIVNIAREAGSRSKVAVESTQPGVDPVGSCVGQKGVRVQAVINELNNEKIDIIQYSEDKSKYIQSALAPADGLDVTFNPGNGETVVTVPADQLSLAIGRSGQNVKLAARLTGSKIRIVSAADKTQEASIVTTGDEEYEIDQLELDTKTRNMLVEAGLTRIESLVDENLDGVKGIGPKTLDKIRIQLAAYKN